MQGCTPDRGSTPRHIAALSDDRANRSEARGSALSKFVEICSAATAVVAVDGDGAPLKDIQLLPMGKITPRDGRGPWFLADEAHAQEVIAATIATSGKTDLMVDYDHQSVFAVGPDKGGRAEAAGWISPASLHVRPDGIWASVSWNAAAAAKLAERAYRYVSPYFGSNKATGRITRILNAGLVNQPAITELLAAASIQNPDIPNEEDPSMLKVIAGKLKLADTATEAEITAAIDALQLQADRGESVSAAAVALGLKPEATGEELVTAATAAKSGRAPDLAQYVPIETYNAANSRLNDFLDKRAIELVDAASAQGKIPPTNRDWAIDQARRDEAAFAAFVANQPTVIDPKAADPKIKVPGGKPGLTQEQKNVCATMGWDEATFASTLEQESAQ